MIPVEQLRPNPSNARNLFHRPGSRQREGIKEHV